MPHRKSKQRELVLRVLNGTKTHPSADWIYEQARKEMPGISLGTVYRNLRLIKEQGDLLELQSSSNGSRFDATVVNHYHLRCLSCGNIFDLDMPVRTDIDAEAARMTSFAIDYHRLEFHGCCPSCQDGNKDN